MSIPKGILKAAAAIAILSCSVFGQQLKSPERDAQSIEILTHVVEAAGGRQALAAVHDITESGEITFDWADGVKGPVIIQILGGKYFRMESALANGGSIWIARDGRGSKMDQQKTVQLSPSSAINLGNLTYPVAHVMAALADCSTDVSFVDIEKRNGRSVYRLQVEGQLGLVSQAQLGGPVVKDLLIDALDFNIVGVEDRPFPARNPEVASDSRSRASARRHSDSPSRAIEFSDFRLVNGVRVPFSISTTLLGQQTLSILLNKVRFNSNLSSQDFNH
jgi:hypothetical protein